jgi:Cu/Ag efflux protein CusF
MVFFLPAMRLASACALFSLPACQSQQGPAGPLPSGTVAEDEVTETAIVEKIDLKTRRVTVSLPDGRERTIVVPEEVRNLPQVQKGDQVRTRYYRSVAFEVKPAGSGEPGVSVASGGKHTEVGQLPAAVASETTTVTATITGIDMKAGTVTLTDSEGEEETVKVRDPDDLERVKLGDLVDISYTQAVAISVERLPTK